MNLGDLITSLKNFDYSFNYSDDHRVWRVQSARQKMLINELKTWPMYTSSMLIKSHVPKEFQAEWVKLLVRPPGKRLPEEDPTSST